MKRAFDGVVLTKEFSRAIANAMEVDLPALARRYEGDPVRCSHPTGMESRPFTADQVERWLDSGRGVGIHGIGPALAFTQSGVILVDDSLGSR